MPLEVPQPIINILQVTTLMTFMFVAALWLSLVVWTWRDISLRSSDPLERGAAVLTVGALFVVGYFLYRLFRPQHTLQERYVLALEEEAILQGLEDLRACGECGGRASEHYLYCPYCRASLKEPCKSCSAAMEPAWAVCAYCGSEKGRPAAIPAAAAAGG